MTRINHTDPHNLQLPPWNLQGEGFIFKLLAYPQFLKNFAILVCPTLLQGASSKSYWYAIRILLYNLMMNY